MPSSTLPCTTSHPLAFSSSRLAARTKSAIGASMTGQGRTKVADFRVPQPGLEGRAAAGASGSSGRKALLDVRQVRVAEPGEAHVRAPQRVPGDVLPIGSPHPARDLGEELVLALRLVQLVDPVLDDVAELAVDDLLVVDAAHRARLFPGRILVARRILRDGRARGFPLAHAAASPVLLPVAFRQVVGVEQQLHEKRDLDVDLHGRLVGGFRRRGLEERRRHQLPDLRGLLALILHVRADVLLGGEDPGIGVAHPLLEVVLQALRLLGELGERGEIAAVLGEARLQLVGQDAGGPVPHRAERKGRRLVRLDESRDLERPVHLLLADDVERDLAGGRLGAGLPEDVGQDAAAAQRQGEHREGGVALPGFLVGLLLVVDGLAEARARVGVGRAIGQDEVPLPVVLGLRVSAAPLLEEVTHGMLLSDRGQRYRGKRAPRM